MTPKDNRIAELEAQVKQIYEKLGMSEESEFAEKDYLIRTWPSGKKTLGRAVIPKYGEELIFLAIESYDQEGRVQSGHLYGFVDNGYNGTPYYKPDDAEVKKHLRKEWERRTKEKGWDDPDEADIEGHASGDNQASNIGIYSALYDHELDELWTKNGCVYHDGNWATPKEKKSDKFFEWDVDKIDASTFDSPLLKIYKIGCESYESTFLQDLKEALEYMPDKTVQEVLDELKKLDL